MKIDLKYILLIAFIEGASVMAIELAGAKMIAPFYGTSLHVWASVLAVTLGGLTLGYFLGGISANKISLKKLLFAVLLSGTILIALMPTVALNTIPATHNLGLKLGTLVATISYMFLPLICMGMVSPILIQITNSDVNTSGKSAGTIYAVSTIGGIVMTLLMGFYLLPDWGIRKSLMLTSILFGITPFILFILIKKYKSFLIAGFCFVALIMISATKPFKDPDINLKFLYRSEGVLGQVTVLDNPHPETNQLFRFLMINQIPQTQVNVQTMPVSAWSYPHRIATLSSIKAKVSKALLIGMGGGSIAMELKKMGFDLDVVEIDKRMPEVAQKYFAFSPKGIDITIDDGRHFINSTDQKYDLVVFDVLNGENQPFHLFTKEAFSSLKQIINSNALVIVNFQGFFDGANGLAPRSIFKTLSSSGFKMKYFYSGNEQEDGDVHLIASLSDLDFSKIDETRLNDCCLSFEHSYKNLITEKRVVTDDVDILQDDKPKLEVINTIATEMWRKRTIETYLVNLPGYEIPFFQ